MMQNMVKWMINIIYDKIKIFIYENKILCMLYIKYIIVYPTNISAKINKAFNPIKGPINYIIIYSYI